MSPHRDEPLCVDEQNHAKNHQSIDDKNDLRGDNPRYKYFLGKFTFFFYFVAFSYSTAFYRLIKIDISQQET